MNKADLQRMIAHLQDTLAHAPDVEEDEPAVSFPENGTCAFCRRTPNPGNLLLSLEDRSSICEDCTFQMIDIFRHERIKRSRKA